MNKFRNAALIIWLVAALCPLILTEIALADGEPQATNDAGKTSAPAAPQGVGLEYASPADASAAVGHYARSRSLLIAAINEFDRGYKIARPDALINSGAWRASVIDRAEELERVLGSTEVTLQINTETKSLDNDDRFSGVS